MNYVDVIRDNIANSSPVPWWPKFAYHYTNITNAVRILEMGRLYSRAKAEQLGIMSNDNASRQVIDMTNSDAKQNVRFYFRPLTPTQYHNEGYKHPLIRYGNDLYANCPVPVFFVFDLPKLLSMPGVTFSETSRAGFGSSEYSTVEDFAKFDFKRIYGSGPMANPEQDKSFRQAELSHPSPMEIDLCLRSVLCRNEFEQSMLLSMLKASNFKIYKKYLPIIKVCKQNMFQRNGLYIDNCIYHDNILSITFANKAAKSEYLQRYISKHGSIALTPLTARLDLDWMKVTARDSEVVFHGSAVVPVDYENAKPINFRLPSVRNSKLLRISLYIEEALMCYKEQFLDEATTIL